MAIERTTVRLALVAALLVSAGCTSRGGRFPLARLVPRSKPSQAARRSDEVLPKYNKNQLLAAARQYEKEGRTDQATVYYRQVLALDPQNAEARQGLQVVQSGERRENTNIDELIADSRPTGSPLSPANRNPSDDREQINEDMAMLLAEAIAKKEAAESTEPAQPIMAVSASEPKPNVAATQFAVYDWGTTRPTEPKASAPVATQARVTEPKSIPESPQELNADSPAPMTPIAETEVSLEVVDAEDLENPADWSDESNWQPRTVTNLCQDANAAVLREVAKLDSQDAAVRKEGLWNLAEMGTDAKSAADAVRILLSDQDEVVRAHAAWATWELTGDANTTVQSLTKLVGSSNTDVVQFAAFTLAGIGEQAQPAAPVLRRQLQSEDTLIRLHAAEALAKVGSDADKISATRTLISLTSEGETQVRVLSLMALGDSTELPTPETATAITQALHDSDAEVRSTAALTLGSFGKAAESAIGQLEFVANNDEQPVRDAAATAIACIRK